MQVIESEVDILAFPSSVRKIEIEQKIEYGFTKECVEKFLADMPVDKYLFIEHGRNVLDKDGLPIEDKDPHIHLYVWFKSPIPTKNIINKLLSFGCSCDYPQLEKIKKDDSAVAYATHENCDKPTYPRSCCNANFEFDTVIEKEVARKNAKRDVIRCNEILKMIDDGQIRAYNISEKIDVIEYNTYKRDIDNAFKYRLNKLQRKADRDMKCIYIYGDAQTGKTSFAKDLCDKRQLDYYVSSSANDVLDGYNGQPALILDDLRPSALGLADLLKLLDNNTSSSVRSRYYNKVLECQVIIITTIMPIDEFFKNVFSEQPETIVQLKRRCELLIHMTDDNYEVYCYSGHKRDYEKFATLYNSFSFKNRAKIDEMTDSEKMALVSSVLGQTAESINKLADMAKVASENPEFMQIDGQMSLDEFPFL